MAYARPTLTELIDRVISDISSRVIGVDGAVLRRSLLGVLGRAEAGAVHMLYGYIDWASKQCFPDTAEKEYLERWARIWGITRKTAGYAVGSVLMTGTLGRSVDAGTILQRQDGEQYQVLETAKFTSQTATISVRAVAAGSNGNAVIATPLFLLSPIAGVQTVASASTALAAGADVEKDARLLARLLERIQAPPQGGAESDYELWALEVSGVTRAWVYPLQQGLGTVTVLFVCDDEANIIPTPAKVAEVQAHINAKAPVTAEVFVAAPIGDPLNSTVKISPNSSAVQAAVRAELSDLVVRDSKPGSPILLSRIREAVSLAAGEENNQVVTPTADVPHATGHMAIMGTITFSTL